MRNLSPVSLKITLLCKIQGWIAKRTYGHALFYPFMQIATDGTITISFCWKGTHDVAWFWMFPYERAPEIAGQLIDLYKLAAAYQDSDAMKKIFVKTEHSQK